MTRFHTAAAASVVLLTLGIVVRADDAPARARAGAPSGSAAAPEQGRGGGRGAGTGAAPQPAVQQVSGKPPVDAAKADAGKALWATQCISCHGTQARGTDTGPNIIRSEVVNFDRSSFAPGSVLGPFLKKGHPTQSGKPIASFTDEEMVDLAQFLRDRVNDTMRGSAIFVAGDVLTGNAKAGEAYFNGPGRCATCHTSAMRNLAGIGTRVPSAVDLQQRMLFPSGGGGRGGGRGGGAPDPNAITVTLTPSTGPAMSGVLVAQDDFFITYRGADNQIHVVRQTPSMKVAITNPMQAHIDLLDSLTDTNIHDLVAYLETMK